ncbi:hypothetical protein IAI53_03180 [Thauera sp. CAU 1555]|uniref:Uncharacterized protein n=1 Tax=Thauera sedimentorum TaxID=2767595 RepID=A0ABR9B9J1_9RHOO|nr:hypothetical protein [Thauera sedimentorum]MBC9070957.1 hypothetical protein [Thauera sedimentorum]MBD8501876.1 hypothetical protein [Thauera sedimentorum]
MAVPLRLHQFRHAMLYSAMSGFQRLAGTKADFGCGDVAGLAGFVQGGNISTLIRLAVASMPPLQPLRNRRRRGSRQTVAPGYLLAAFDCV